MKHPNFFIIGAPKCGTTALAQYLAEHPRIFMSKPKEPHYFAEDFPNHRFVSSWEDYLQLFAEAGSEHLAVGEASVFYLRSEVAVPNLLQKFPDARIIVMLRNPLELAPSMHAQALAGRNETVTSFAQAWAMRDLRRKGCRIPRGCREVKTILYDEIAMQGRALNRVLSRVPRSRIAWWFHQDLADDTAKVYADVLSFLGVPHDGREDFPRINTRKQARIQLVAQFTEKTPQPLLRGAVAVKNLLGIRRLDILNALRKRNFTSAQAPPLDDDLVNEMRDTFRDDIVLLERITQRDLSHWLSTTVGPRH